MRFAAQKCPPFTLPIPVSHATRSTARFDAYYVHRVKPIKRAADALGISRQHFYALLAAFRVRVWNAAEAIADDNQRAHQAMLARRAERSALIS